MAKTKSGSGSASKSGGGGYSGYSHNNISSGGHVYDRNTGTWVGETQGTFGGGYTGDGIGRPSMVIHDANGPVGIKFADRPSPGAGSAAGVTSNGGQQPGTVSGPGAPAVATSKPSGDKPRGLTLPDMGALTGKPMKNKGKDEVTVIRPGTDLWLPNPYFSDADQWEQRGGEPGDWIGGAVTMTADLVYNVWRLSDFGADSYLDSPLAGVSEAQKKANAEAIGGFFWGKPMDPVQDGKLPKQEPVDWGL